MRASKLIVLMAGVMATLSVVVICTASDKLSQDDMINSRGGGPEARKCSETCNRANNYINLCKNGNSGNPCTTCSDGTVTVNYTDMDPTCGNGGFKTSATGTVSCGFQQTGSCTGIGACTKPVVSLNQCNIQSTVVAQ